MTINRSHSGAPVDQISAGTPPDGVTDAIHTMMRTSKIPGLSVAVVNRERVLLAAGYGLADRAAPTPATGLPRAVHTATSPSRSKT